MHFPFDWYELWMSTFHWDEIWMPIKIVTLDFINLKFSFKVFIQFLCLTINLFEVSNGWHFNQTFESSLIFYILIFDHGLAINQTIESFFTWWLWLPQYHWVFKNKHRIISHQINWFVRKHLRKSGLAVMLLWALTVVNAKWIDIKLWSMLTHCSVDCFRATQCKRYQCM